MAEKKGNSKIRFITPNGVERFRLNPKEVVRICNEFKYIRINGKTRQLECFVEALAFSNEKQSRAFKAHCDAGYQIHLLD